MPRRPFIVFHPSLSRPIRAQGDVDADTSQGQLFVWCIWLLWEADFSISNEKQAGDALIGPEYMDVSLFTETKEWGHVFAFSSENKPLVQGTGIN